jgi:AraC-like DNA-binding protein
MKQSELLSERDSSQYPELVQDAVSLIEAGYAYLYGIDDLADQLQVSKHHLIRLFTAAAGVSPGQYLIHVRMLHAKLLLQSQENTPLEIIAGACGYSCANYFTKAFKKHIGMTPTQYIQTVKDGPMTSVRPDLDRFYL